MFVVVVFRCGGGAGAVTDRLVLLAAGCCCCIGSFSVYFFTVANFLALEIQRKGAVFVTLVATADVAGLLLSLTHPSFRVSVVMICVSALHSRPDCD